MFTPETQIVFHWKEPLLIFAVACALFVAWNRYLLVSYERIMTDYLSCRHNSLYGKAQRLQKHFSPGVFPPRKRLLPYYHNISYVLAALSLLSGNEEDFLHQLSQIDARGYVLKPFTLALYYYAKGQSAQAQDNYAVFLTAAEPTPAMVAVMTHLFTSEPNEPADASLQKLFSEFKNPAIVFLLRRARLIN